MGFKNFRLNVMIRVFLLSSFLFISIWSVLSTAWEVTPIICFIICILCIIELIHYTEHTNRKLKQFLHFVSQHDFTTDTISSNIGSSFSELSDAYAVITEEFRRLNAEREANHLFLDSVVEHVNVALLCLDENNHITLMNRSAKELFQLKYAHSHLAFRNVDSTFPHLLDTIENGEHKLIDIHTKNEKMRLSVYARRFQLLSKRYKLLSFQNIRDDLERQEIDSWQKLIRVLTHEIMNSVTPIISLTETMKEKLVMDESTFSRLTDDELHDLSRSVCSIESRSKGLHHFVKTYRRLTSIPKPMSEPTSIRSSIENIKILLLPELDKHDINLQITQNLNSRKVLPKINIDPHQIEQVLINIVKNSIESLVMTEFREGRPEIKIHIELDNTDNMTVKIIDNGPGIQPDHLDQIFVPFFSTKKNGTGVGLSISRQMVVQNGGVLSASSSPNEGCEFSMRFSILKEHRE